MGWLGATACAFLGALATSGACGGGGGQPAPDTAFLDGFDGWFPTLDTATDASDTAAPDSPVGSGAAADARLGPDGGTLTLEGVTLTIPAGALPEGADIRIVSRTEPAPYGIIAWSPLFGFEPAGLVFQRPVRVTLPFSGDPARVVIFWSSADGTRYERLGGVVDGATISAEVTHFSSGAAGDGFAGPCAGAAPGWPGSTWPDPGTCTNPNGVCEARLGEYCDICNADCGPCQRPPFAFDGLRCGDGTCQTEYEDKLLCPIDCAGCEWCGDQTCTQGRESAATCPVDCAQARCGDGACDPERESKDSCPGDCEGEGFCGDGVCDTSAGERLVTCRADCAGGRIGDGNCDPDENTYVTHADCYNGWNELDCHDGKCRPGEWQPCVCPDTPPACGPPDYFYTEDDCPSSPGEFPPDATPRERMVQIYNWACDERMTPICARDFNGRYLCGNKMEEYQLLLSNYKVDAFGLGQHQGMGIRKVVSWFDSRSGDICSVEQDEASDGIIARIYNHGRTVDTGMREDALGRKRRNYMIIAKQEAVIDGIDHELAQQDSTQLAGLQPAASLANCIQAIPDGFCDQVCGNDGYTLPEALIFTDERACEKPSLTPKDAHLPDYQQPGDELPCVRQPGSFSKSIPKWGHNSNSDADAARDFFLACSSDLRDDGQARSQQDWLELLAPAICALHCDSSPVAEGCVTKNNVAKMRVEWCDGCMRLPTSLASGGVDHPAIADCYNRDTVSNGGADCMHREGPCLFEAGGKHVKGF